MTFEDYFHQKQQQLDLLKNEWNSLPTEHKPIRTPSSKEEWDDWWETHFFLIEEGEIEEGETYMSALSNEKEI